MRYVVTLAIALLMVAHIHANDANERAYFLRAINRDPTDLQSHLGYQRVARKMGDLEQLKSEYRAYLRDNPGKGLYLFLYGRLLENPEHVRNYLQQAVRADTTLFHAQVELGRSHYHDGQYEEAIGRYRAALRLKPESATTYNLLGLTYYHRGHPKQAIAEYQRAIANKPNYTDAYLNLGLAFYFTDQFEEAVETYQKALAQTEANGEHHLIYHNLGMAYRKQDQPEKARTAYQNALKHKSDYAESHISLGNLSFSQKEYATAIQSYNQAIGTESENADLHLRLALAYFNKQTYPKAIEHLNTTLQKDSTNVQVYEFLGKAYNLNEQPNEAIKALEAYIAREKRYSEKGRVAQAKTLLFEIKRDQVINILK